MRPPFCSFLLLAAFAWRVQAQDSVIRSSLVVAGKPAKIQIVQSLPFVENEYTRRFHFDSADNPKLKELRNRYDLDAVIAPGRTEFQKQILLNDWTHRQFRKFGHPSNSARGALQILSGIKAGEAYFCSQYAELLVSAAASLGWNDRLLALRRHQGVNAHGGSTEHTTTEIWSDEHSKWVMLDPTSNMYLEKNGLPLNAWEIRQEWFYHGGTNLTFVVGKDQIRYRKRDLPVVLDHFADFGDLTIDPDELDKYGFIGYIPNTDLMDSGNDYGRMFIVKDRLCDGTKWHERVLPIHPESDPYFPLNQVDPELVPSGESVEVDLKTFTPNFATFEKKLDDAGWQPALPKLTWKPHRGSNRLEIRSMNKFGVAGPSTIVEIRTP
jgi:hypothetical protein